MAWFLQEILIDKTICSFQHIVFIIQIEYFFRILYFIIRIFILKRFNSASEPQPIAVFCLGESAYSAVRIFIDKYFNAGDQETSSSSSFRDLSSPNDEEEGENKPNDVIKPNEVVALQFTLKETLKL